MISKEQFLIEHNKLSPLSLQATLFLLTRFQKEKRPLLKNDGWSIDKLRIPFISWLLALPEKKKKKDPKGTPKEKNEQVFKNYPNTKT